MFFIPLPSPSQPRASPPAASKPARKAQRADRIKTSLEGSSSIENPAGAATPAGARGAGRLPEQGARSEAAPGAGEVHHLAVIRPGHVDVGVEVHVLAEGVNG